MSTNATLSAEPRQDTGKGVARKLRAAGRVPAVVYGQDADPQLLSVDAHEADVLFTRISVDNTIVSLKIGGKKGVDTLVREVQVHPYRRQLLHVDFYTIQKGVALDVDVPVRLDGVPEGVRLEGGTLEHIVHDLSVRCVPSKIPSEIVVDVSGLQIGDSIHVSEITLDEGVELITDPARTVCTVAQPRVEEEPVEEELEEGEEPEGEVAEGEEPTAEAQPGGEDDG